MMSRNRSWISHAKKTVLEGKSFPRCLDVDIPTAEAATVPGTSKLLLLLVREFLLLDDEMISRKSFSDIEWVKVGVGLNRKPSDRPANTQQIIACPKTRSLIFVMGEVMTTKVIIFNSKSK